jgi:SAM-dependent methyltransferase
MRHCQYVGYDISASMLDAARGGARPLLRCRFVGRDEPRPEVDYCLASGVFNVSLGADPELWFEYMTHAWDEMNRLARRAFAFNCLSAHADIEGRTNLLHYADPLRVLDHCRRAYSPRVALLQDYPLPEFTVIVRKPRS